MIATRARSEWLLILLVELLVLLALAAVVFSTAALASHACDPAPAGWSFAPTIRWAMPAQPWQATPETVSGYWIEARAPHSSSDSWYAAGYVPCSWQRNAQDQTAWTCPGLHHSIPVWRYTGPWTVGFAREFRVRGVLYVGGHALTGDPSPIMTACPEATMACRSICGPCFWLVDQEPYSAALARCP